MPRTIRKGALLAGAIAIAFTITSSAYAKPHTQIKAKKLAHRLAHKPPVRHAMVAVTYTGEAAKQSSTTSNSGFWLNGGSVDGAATFSHGLGLAANLSIVHAHDFTSNVSVGKTTIAFGPRYTRDISDWTRKAKWLRKEDWFRRKLPSPQIYGEVLFGVAHGFDSAFPEGTSINSSADSFALQLGAGFDITLWHQLGARLFELDYIRSGLPNGAANNQSDLRLSFGVNYRFDAPASRPLAAVTKTSPATDPLNAAPLQ